MPERTRTEQTLLFDADDTLWENNIYFERAIASFISHLDHRQHSAEEVRERLNAVEHRTIAAQGYGLKSFRQSLVECFEELTTAPPTPEDRREILRFADAIGEHQIELLPGVDATLGMLAGRHRLMVVTKGDAIEQRDKCARSGLEKHFFALEVVGEKNEASYREIAQRYALPEGRTWMIGNSPKSDVNPAMAAGLHAIFVPHGSTWVLEREDIAAPPPGVTLLELGSFHQLLEHF